MGSFGFYSGPAGTSGAPGSGLPPGTADGQILQWDNISGTWIPVGAPSTDGQVLVWDTATSRWISRTVTSWQMGFYCSSTPATLITYLHVGGQPSSGGASHTNQALSQDIIIRPGFLRRMTVSNNTVGAAAAITYTLQVNGVNTAMSVLHNTSTAGAAQDLANVIPVANLDLVGIRLDNPVPTNVPTCIRCVRVEGFSLT